MTTPDKQKKEKDDAASCVRPLGAFCCPEEQEQHYQKKKRGNNAKNDNKATMTTPDKQNKQKPDCVRSLGGFCSPEEQQQLSKQKKKGNNAFVSTNASSSSEDSSYTDYILKEEKDEGSSASSSSRSVTDHRATVDRVPSQQESSRRQPWFLHPAADPRNSGRQRLWGRKRSRPESNTDSLSNENDYVEPFQPQPQPQMMFLHGRKNPNENGGGDGNAATSWEDALLLEAARTVESSSGGGDSSVWSWSGTSSLSSGDDEDENEKKESTSEEKEASAEDKQEREPPPVIGCCSPEDEETQQQEILRRESNNNIRARDFVSDEEMNENMANHPSPPNGHQEQRPPQDPVLLLDSNDSSTRQDLGDDDSLEGGAVARRGRGDPPPAPQPAAEAGNGCAAVAMPDKNDHFSNGNGPHALGDQKENEAVTTLSSNTPCQVVPKAAAAPLPHTLGVQPTVLVISSWPRVALPVAVLQIHRKRHQRDVSAWLLGVPVVSSLEPVAPWNEEEDNDTSLQEQTLEKNHAIEYCFSSSSQHSNATTYLVVYNHEYPRIPPPSLVVASVAPGQRQLQDPLLLPYSKKRSKTRRDRSLEEGRLPPPPLRCDNLPPPTPLPLTAAVATLDKNDHFRNGSDQDALEHQKEEVMATSLSSLSAPRLVGAEAASPQPHTPDVQQMVQLVSSWPRVALPVPVLRIQRQLPPRDVPAWSLVLPVVPSLEPVAPWNEDEDEDDDKPSRQEPPLENNHHAKDEWLSSFSQHSNATTYLVVYNHEYPWIPPPSQVVISAAPSLPMTAPKKQREETRQSAGSSVSTTTPFTTGDQQFTSTPEADANSDHDNKPSPDGTVTTKTTMTTMTTKTEIPEVLLPNKDDKSRDGGDSAETTDFRMSNDMKEQAQVIRTVVEDVVSGTDKRRTDQSVPSGTVFAVPEHVVLYPKQQQSLLPQSSVDNNVQTQQGRTCRSHDDESSSSIPRLVDEVETLTNSTVSLFEQDVKTSPLMTGANRSLGEGGLSSESGQRICGELLDVKEEDSPHRCILPLALVVIRNEREESQDRPAESPKANKRTPKTTKGTEAKESISLLGVDAWLEQCKTGISDGQGWLSESPTEISTPQSFGAVVENDNFCGPDSRNVISIQRETGEECYNREVPEFNPQAAPQEDTSSDSSFLKLPRKIFDHRQASPCGVTNEIWVIQRGGDSRHEKDRNNILAPPQLLRVQQAEVARPAMEKGVSGVTDLLGPEQHPAARPKFETKVAEWERFPQEEEISLLLEEIHSRGDGRLSLKDVDKAMIKRRISHPPTVLLRAFHEVDSDEDGFVSREDFRCFVRSISYYTHLWDIFSLIDRSGTRRLSKNEFLVAAPTLQIADPNDVFAEMNDDQSGYVVFDQFCIFVEGHHLGHKFVQLCAAAVFIQRNFRRWRTVELTRSKEAAILIQRLHRQHKREQAATTIQRGVRNYWNIQTERLRIQRTIKIQAASRRWSARRKYRNLYDAVLLIQRRCRQHQQRFEARRRAAMELLARAERVQTLKTYSATVIQRRIRKWKIQKLVAKTALAATLIMQMESRSATTIQTSFRTWTASRRHRTLRNKSISIQNKWRAHKCLAKFTSTRQSTIWIQKNWRKFSARQRFKRQRRAVVCIQSGWGSARTQQMYKKSLARVCMLQAYARRWLATLRWNRMRRGVVALQGLCRKHHCRRSFMEHKESAVCVQAGWRMVDQRRLYAAKRRAVLRLQTVVRMRLCATRYQRARRSAQVVQSTWRSYEARQSFVHQRNAATQIQSHWRMVEAVRRHHTLLSKVCIIQALTRRWIAETRFKRGRNGVVKLQSIARGQQSRHEYQMQRNAATTMQSTWRMSLARKRFAAQEKAVVCIQSGWRSARTQQMYKKSLARVCMLQAYARRWLATLRWNRMRRGVVALQGLCRKHHCRRSFMEHKESAVCVQAGWRMVDQRRLYAAKRRAVLRLQTVVRMRQCATRYQRARRSAQVVQSTWRSYEARQSFVHQRNAATQIQSHWRMVEAVRRHHTLLSKVCIIQAVFRGWMSRRCFVHNRESAIAIQRGFRRYQIGRGLVVSLKVYSATVIQRSFRRWVCRGRYGRERSAAVGMQSLARKRRLKRVYAGRRVGAIVVQRAGILSFTKLQTERARMLLYAAVEPLPIVLMQEMLQVERSKDMELILENVKDVGQVRNHCVHVNTNIKPTQMLSPRFHVWCSEAKDVFARECWRVLMEWNDDLLQMGKHRKFSTDEVLARDYLLKHAVRHVLESSLFDADDQEYAERIELEVYEFLKNPSFLWVRAASTKTLDSLARGYFDFGARDCALRQGEGSVGISERRFITLVGRAIQDAQPRCRAVDSTRELPGQIMGRLLGPSQPDSGEPKKVQEYIREMLNEWRTIDFGFSWWCPKHPTWGSASNGQELEAEHSNAVWTTAISPDGEHVASGSLDNTVRIWNTTTGKTTHKLNNHSNWVISLSWSPDGSKLAAGSWDGTISVWDKVKGETTCILQGHSDAVFSVAWSPDGTQVASGSSDGTVRLWNATTGETTQILKGHTDWVVSVSWSRDGNNVASASNDKSIRIWSVKGGKCLHVLHGHTDSVVFVLWSPDGRNEVVSGSQDDTVRTWNATTGVAIQVLEGGEAIFPDKAFDWSNVDVVSQVLLAKVGWREKQDHASAAGVDCEQFSCRGTHAVGVFQSRHVAFFELIERPSRKVNLGLQGVEAIAEEQISIE